jgi:hypothetical protein
MSGSHGIRRRTTSKPAIRNYGLFVFLLLLSTVALSDEPDVARDYQRLFSKYQSIRNELQTNQYSAPVFIQSDFQEDMTSGEVYALVDHEFDKVAANLGSSKQWCDVVLLHINVKGCDIGAGIDTPDQLTLYVGRRYYQTPDEASEIQYRFHRVSTTQDYMHVDLTATNGPFGTSDYLLTFEVIPVNTESSFIHFKYAYHFGFMAKLAIDGYLATIGRHKVGFTIKEYDKENQPVYIQGLQGIVERNSMRYFLAIRSFLDTVTSGENEWDDRINHWYELAKGFERQFIEVREKEYIDTKRKEFLNREKMLRTAALKSNSS